MKLVKILAVLVIAAGVVYFVSMSSSSDDDKPQKVQKERGGVALEEKYGATSEQALP